MTKALIVGGGPAGMIAAIAAAEEGASVTLLERNEKLGKKLYITGKGRCNITNDCEREAFFAAIPRNPRFLYSAYSRFSPQELMATMQRLGVPMTVERGNRVFPASQKASDVTRALAQRMQQLGVEVRLNTRVSSLALSGGRVCGVRDEAGTLYPADCVVIATGGLAYPLTGSTGDGYELARQAGHRVTPTYPSLISLEAGDPWIPGLQGLSLKNVRLTARLGKKTLFSGLGEMMFTHYGITGPLVLTLSALLPQEGLETAAVHLDLKPGLTEEQLKQRIQREFEAHGSRQLMGALAELLPRRLLEAVLEAAGLAPELSIHHLSRQQRETLLASFKALPIHLKGRRGFDEAVVTRGGVDVKEIDPKTMQSRKAEGLYFAGEVLDVDGFTGGFNLQIAFSTGYSAGKALKPCTKDGAPV